MYMYIHLCLPIYMYIFILSIVIVWHCFFYSVLYCAPFPLLLNSLGWHKLLIVLVTLLPFLLYTIL